MPGSVKMRNASPYDMDYGSMGNVDSANRSQSNFLEQLNFLVRASERPISTLELQEVVTRNHELADRNDADFEKIKIILDRRMKEETETLLKVRRMLIEALVIIEKQTSRQHSQQRSSRWRRWLLCK